MKCLKVIRLVELWILWQMLVSSSLVSLSMTNLFLWLSKATSLVKMSNINFTFYLFVLV
jgi:hypothetical protein